MSAPNPARTAPQRHADETQRLLASLEQEDRALADARARGCRTDIAIGQKRKEELFGRWRELTRADLENQMGRLAEAIDVAVRQFAWWEELQILGDGPSPSTISSAQQRIFHGAKRMPNSWTEARDILALLPEYRPPDKPLAQAIAELKQLLGAAFELEKQTKAFESALADESYTAAGWNEYRTNRHPAYRDAVRAFEAAWEKAYA